jgi:hypothetical protein
MRCYYKMLYNNNIYTQDKVNNKTMFMIINRHLISKQEHQ